MMWARENTDRRSPTQVALTAGLSLLIALGDAGAQTLRGVVVDATTKTPIAGTIIQAYPERGNQPRRATSDTAGAFFLGLPEPGLYRIVATKIGYQQHRGDTVRVGNAETVSLEIQLDRSAVPLRPVVVTERYSGLPEGFEQRRAAGFGRFMTRKDIEARRGSQTTDLFRGMPGIQLTPVRRGRGPGQVLQMRGPAGICSPGVWIDGIPLTDGGSALDDILSPGVLEAVEVYNSLAAAPLQYRTGTCGVVLFWTKRGPTDDRVKTKWWKLALGATVGVGLVFLIRKQESR